MSLLPEFKPKPQVTDPATLSNPSKVSKLNHLPTPTLDRLDALDTPGASRNLALKEGSDVTVTEPEWSTQLQGLVPDSRTIRIPAVVRTKIEAIEAEARAKGWPVELLYSCDFWALPRGLAAVLDEDDEIGEVPHDYIEILRCRRDVLRFQRRNS